MHKWGAVKNAAIATTPKTIGRTIEAARADAAATNTAMTGRPSSGHACAREITASRQWSACWSVRRKTDAKRPVSVPATQDNSESSSTDLPSRMRRIAIAINLLRLGARPTLDLSIYGNELSG